MQIKNIDGRLRDQILNVQKQEFATHTEKGDSLQGLTGSLWTPKQ